MGSVCDPCTSTGIPNLALERNYSNNSVKNSNNNNAFKSEPKRAEDFVCLVCNDGDYGDDNLIVFCSGCNICVHQKCYGITKIPENDWFCDVCVNFGEKGKYLRCPLCTNKGGAMKETTLFSNDKFFQKVNPSYYNVYEHVDTSKPIKPVMDPNYAIYLNENDKSKKTPIKANQDDTSEECKFYDYYKLPKDFPKDEQKANEPKPPYAWCHSSCGIWMSEIVFVEKNPDLINSDHKSITNIIPKNKIYDGIERIDKKRFQLTCALCQHRSGACIQCARGKCAIAFHVECARRAKMFMEIKNSENHGFIIYCERHAPLKVKRTLESKVKIYIDEVSKFIRSIDKFYQSYSYKFEQLPNYDGGNV